MHEIFAAIMIIYAFYRILHSTEKVFLLNMVNWLHHLTINRLIPVGCVYGIHRHFNNISAISLDTGNFIYLYHTIHIYCSETSKMVTQLASNNTSIIPVSK